MPKKEHVWYDSKKNSFLVTYWGPELSPKIKADGFTYTLIPASLIGDNTKVWSLSFNHNLHYIGAL